MGRRPPKARFMPGVYVVPGGSLEAGDRRPSGLAESFPSPLPGVDTDTARKLPALIRTAFRELWEETGLLLADGTAVSRPGKARSCTWRSYARAGLQPAFATPRLILRAVTPSAWPIRFDTRFFWAPGTLARGSLAGDGELEDLGWVSFDRLGDLPLAAVTRRVLAEALALWQAPAGRRRPPARLHPPL